MPFLSPDPGTPTMGECILNAHLSHEEPLLPAFPFLFFKQLPRARAPGPALRSLEIRHVTGTVEISGFHGLSQFSWV